MFDWKWSKSEKKLCRELIDAAMRQELSDILAEFKAKAAAVQTPDEMWQVEEFLTKSRRQFDSKYRFSYSAVILLLARLVREGRIACERLDGLAEEKRALVRKILAPS